MADYYPLLARALDALPDRSPALRKAVYDRARNALVSQLRSLEPPLSEADIDTERRALDAAIARLEADHGGIPAPANDAVVAPEPPPVPPPPASQSAIHASDIPEPSPPALPPAPAPSFVPIPVPPAAEPRETPIPIAPPRPVAPPFQPAPEEPEPVTEPVEETAGTEVAEPASSDSANGRQRPRIAVVPPRAGRSRVLRNAFVGTVLAVVIGLIAVAAFLLRDRPQALQPGATGVADAQQPEGEVKFGDRVGGETTPPIPRQEGSATPRVAPSRAGAPAAQVNPTVAQRATLVEEPPGGEGAQPVTTAGRVTWRLDTANAEQGQPLQTVVSATVTFPEAGLTLVMTLQRNLDATLPASHTINLAFSQTGPDAAARVVQDIGLLQAKEDENGRGSPLSGLPVRVRDNLFLIGLSSLRADVERNTDLLLHRNWFDLAVRYTSGKRAVLTFEKGAAGAQVLKSAFDAWQ